MITPGESQQDKNLRSSLFWVITQPVVAIPYRRFGTTCPSHLQESRIEIDPLLQMVLISCAEMSVRN